MLTLKILGLWLLVWNLAAFAAMGADKRRARLGRWRIRESTLFLLALPGSALGATLGMLLFRHKTKHWYFRWGLPLLLAGQTALLGWLLWRLYPFHS